MTEQRISAKCAILVVAPVRHLLNRIAQVASLDSIFKDRVTRSLESVFKNRMVLIQPVLLFLTI